jgi:hypothetical protein
MIQMKPMTPEQPKRDKIPSRKTRRGRLLDAVGIWTDRTDLPETEQYIRELRTGNRIERFLAQVGALDRN